ncbi:MAG: hypothetical protein A2X23_01935 [Chloroflexi bacterium GWC2_73_18]|nr:MAG: hypothetical protein A2X23_01935 [Chloroflexi bacterium GWC2_73_18]
MWPATIVLDFDPFLGVGDRAVRWETLALAAALFLGLALAARLAGRADEPGEERLRRDDLLYIALGAVPGAVVGGRLLHGLDFLAYYQATPERLVDPSLGSLSLLGGVIGGTVTAAYVAALLAAPVRRWLDVAIVPLLLVIGLGKLANLLGGTGQGAPTDATWALAFAGEWSWRSPLADVPAHPSQVYEAIWTLAGIVLLAALRFGPVLRALPGRWRRPAYTGDHSGGGLEAALGPGRLRGGYLFLFGLAWWSAGRVVVGFTWRDDLVVGGLRMEQLAALAVLACVALVLLIAPGREGKRG